MPVHDRSWVEGVLRAGQLPETLGEGQEARGDEGAEQGGVGSKRQRQGGEGGQGMEGQEGEVADGRWGSSAQDFSFGMGPGGQGATAGELLHPSHATPGAASRFTALAVSVSVAARHGHAPSHAPAPHRPGSHPSPGISGGGPMQGWPGKAGVPPSPPTRPQQPPDQQPILASPRPSLTPTLQPPLALPQLLHWLAPTAAPAGLPVVQHRTYYSGFILASGVPGVPAVQVHVGDCVELVGVGIRPILL